GIEQLDPLPGARIGELLEPSLAETRPINARSRAKNTARTIARFDPVHHSRGVAHAGGVGAGQFLERRRAVRLVIDGLEQVGLEQVSQFTRIEGVALVTLFQRGIATWITHDQLLDRKSTRLNSSHVSISY